MSKKVILYIRVSTDEQAEKGYSLPAQEDKLRRYCASKGYTVLKVFKEDYSAWKGFDRPEYNNLRAFIKQNKGVVDYLLFTQWSRFSRDIAESLSELKALKRLGVSANAIEQWVDTSIPENLYMQAFYLAAPQVENDRLSLRTKAGLRQALKQGRWTGRAPYGYQNDRLAKIVVPDPVAKEIVVFAFKTFATGIYSMEDVRRLCNEKGIKIGKQQFINVLTNPFYAGKLFIKGNEEEESCMVTGIHEPLVDWETFERVQAFVSKRRKSYKDVTRGQEFFLKGNLLCPVCGKLMTGSASRGNGGVYPYYHCQRKYGCKQAFKADRAHEAMEEYLSTFKVEEEVLSLYQMVLEDVFKTNDVEREEEKRKLQNDVKNIRSKIADLDERLLDQSLPIERYNRLVKTLEDGESELTLKLANLSGVKTEFARYLNYGLSFLADMNRYYAEATPETKRKIIGSIFPQKITFDGKGYRTNKINEVFALICSGDKGFRKIKPGKKARQSTSAPPSGLEPETL